MGVLAQAWQEVRLHPARFAATLTAIVLSVAFLAATQVFAATESNAITEREMLFASRADVVVDSHLWHWPDARLQRDGGLALAEETLRDQPEVVSFERFSQLYTHLSSRDAFAGVKLTTSPMDPELRWYAPSEGRYPETAVEIVLTRDTAADLGVGLGDTVQLNLADVLPLTVVGLTDERGYDDPPAYAMHALLERAGTLLPPPDYSILINPATTARETPGASSGGVGVRLLVRTASPDVASAVVEKTQQALYRAGFLKIIVEPKVAAVVRAEAAGAVAGGAGWLSLLVTGCGAVAVLVGTLIIANTFTILVAQRQRQIGLLRAVGATRGQVLARFVAEAGVLGALGTVLGLPVGVGLAAAVSGWATRSLVHGLVVPWLTLAGVALLGVGVTVLASLIPLSRATRVPPLAALQPVDAVPQAARRSVVRGVVCAAPVAIGAAVMAAGLGAWAGVGSEAWGPVVRVVVVAVGAVGVSVGVLGASSLYVPPLVRLLGAPVVGRWPEARLAVANAVRNPARVGATATAVMLAVGLIVTVQVGSASGRASAFARMDERYPVDLALQSAVAEPDLANPNGAWAGPSRRDATGRLRGFAPGGLDAVRATPGVADAELLTTTEPLLLWTGTGMMRFLPAAVVPAGAQRLLNAPVEVGPGEVGLPAQVISLLQIQVGSIVMLQSLTGDREPSLRVVESNLGPSLAVLHPDTLAALRAHTRDGLILARLQNPDDSVGVVRQLQAQLMADNPGLEVSGSAVQKAMLRTLLDDVTAFLTGLLAVAALVALIGVGNTLGLSVLERSREFALVRALGLQRSGVRLMVLLESLAIALVAVAVGLASGLLFGWAGAAAVAQAFGLSTPPLVVDWPATLLTCALVVAAAALASVLPGRRAARATPVEALADIG
ncbi:FtsX-like permease family protein [Propioniciclava soli]|uniref:FtsX-like permease family protein n=1 Tax=Propioniciclava soli TaxID=2775081 RepID=A0ABZ3C8U8_9ACTN